MKICPHCKNKYTDDSLKFCLQDGNSLEIFVDEKTLVLDQEAFANEKTISDKIGGNTEHYSGKTEAFSARKTEKEEVAENHSKETIIRQKEPIEAPSFANESVQKKSGLSFVTGFLVAILLIGLVGGGILAGLYLPKILGRSSNNSDVSDEKKVRILSNSDEVKVSALTSRKPLKGNVYTPQMAFDGNPRTAWGEGAKGAGIGQWIIFDFKEEVTLKQIVIQPGYFKSEELWRKNNRIASAVFEFSNKKTRIFELPNQMREQKLDVGNIKTKSVRIAIKNVYEGQADAEDTLISEVSFVVE